VEIIGLLKKILGKYYKDVGIVILGVDEEGNPRKIRTLADGRLICAIECAPHADEHAVGGTDPFMGTKHQLSFMLEKLDSHPTESVGRVYFNTTENRPYVCIA